MIDGGVTRRTFLRLGAGVTVLSLVRLRPAAGAPAAAAGARQAYRDWEDLYRAEFSWDRRVRCTHTVNCWYQRNCAWDVFVRDGIVLREEQAGAYPMVSPEVPDFNPRGCQKGACHSRILYAADRLRYPMVRVGERGSGRWKRVTWDEALNKVADGLLDALSKAGPESIIFDPGGSLASASWRAGIARLVTLLDGIELDTNTELDDGQGGASITFGTPVASRSADDLIRSDVILIWGANPIYTQIPNAHFINEARYHGATVVTIAPDYSPSAIHTDLYVPVRPGTDAALALAVAREMLATDRIDDPFVRAQTDLPFLVKEDGRFLREADVKKGGSTDNFYVFDEKAGGIAPVSKTTLDWGDVVPALSGSFPAKTLHGTVSVRPVLQVLRERLDRDFTLEKAAEICGTPLPVLRRLAKVIAGSRAMAGIAGSCIPKFYEGDLIMRAQLLVFVLGGHLGRPGAGFDTTPMLRVEGIDSFGTSQFGAMFRKLTMAPTFFKRRLAGDTKERILSDLIRDYVAHSNSYSSVLYWRKHGGLAERTDQDWGRKLARPMPDYVAESFRMGWQKAPPETPPRVLLLAGSNLLRRLRSSDVLLRKLWPKLDLVVATDIRMSSTCRQADVLLPGTTSYERDDVTNWFTLLSPYLHITQAAVPPVGECKPEWETHVLLAQAIERRARERGMTTYKDRGGKDRRVDDLYARFTMDGKYGPGSHVDVARHIIEQTGFVKSSFDELREKGFERVTGIGEHPINLGNATEVRPDQPVINREWRRTRPGPWPTLTRRIQFYIDHPLYLELGEELPVHREPPMSGGNYPLVLSGGHTRWSIHALWRNVDVLLRLQRGEAAAFVAMADASARGIHDGELIRVWNDAGEFRVRAKLSHALRPGMLIVYHAWEDNQFSGGRGYRNVIPSPLNPAELAGGYVHLRPAPATLQPGQSDRETRVDMARA